jgi:hypothetical protein
VRARARRERPRAWARRRPRAGARARWGRGCGRGHGGGAARAWARRRRCKGVSTASERVRRKKNLPVLCTSALPSARDLALGKDFFNLKIRFAECQIGGTRQRRLCRVSFLDTRQSTFFYFPNQNFCGVFLHYIDLHVPF